jgi:predicted TIM-barrel fold metal-dependent hydrolase
MVITDAQVHLWEAHRPDRPWLPEDVGHTVIIAGEGARPHREKPFEAAEMTELMDVTGVSRAIIVPPSMVGSKNLTALEAVQNYPGRYGIMGRFDPEDPNARVLLETWLTQPGMLGIRMTFHKAKWSRWLADSSLDWFWAGCERLGIPVMVLMSEQLDVLDRLATRYPDLKLILDHMGRKSALRDDACFADLDVMLKLARHKNLSVKVTSAPGYSTHPYPFKNIQPYLQRIIEGFGPERSMWGSDVSRLPCTYAQCVSLFTEEMSFLKGKDLEMVMGGALAKVLNWPAA